MITRKLTPPVVRLSGGAVITLSAKICSRTAGIAHNLAQRFGQECRDFHAPQIMRGLALLHANQRDLSELLDGAEVIVAQIKDAANILDSGNSTQTGAIPDAALAARSMADSALLADAGFSLEELIATRKALTGLVGLLTDDLQVAIRKRDDLIELTKDCVAHAIAAPASDPLAIMDRYRVPDALKGTLDGLTGQGDAPLHDAAMDYCRGLSGDERKAKRARQTARQVAVETAAAAIWQGE